MHILIVFGLLLLILSGKVKVAIRLLLSYVFILLAGRYAMYIPSQLRLLRNILTMFFVPALLFYPIFIFSFYFFTTLNLGKLIGGLEQWKVPQTIIIPIAVMCRFFPTIRLELINIRNAMKLKGGKFNIIKSVEFVYVPLLFNSAKIAEELTISALTRGLGLYKTTTIVVDTKIKIFDIFCIMVLLALLIFSRGLINV